VVEDTALQFTNVLLDMVYLVSLTIELPETEELLLLMPPPP
jgi:hypothetical protein